MKVYKSLAGMLMVLAVTGCRSKYVAAEIRNAGPATISLVEVDYPSASFGVESLAAGATYTYRFKILGSGPTKVLWTDAARKEHTASGPALQEGQEGSLVVTLTAGNAAWVKNLKP